MSFSVKLKIFSEIIYALLFQNQLAIYIYIIVCFKVSTNYLRFYVNDFKHIFYRMKIIISYKINSFFFLQNSIRNLPVFQNENLKLLQISLENISHGITTSIIA